MFNTFNRFGLGAPQMFFATDDSSGGDGGNEGGENPKPKKSGDVNLAVESAFAGLVVEYGSPDAVAKHLIKRNHSLQTSKDKAETELRTLKDQKPDEATQQLTESERTELDAYRALGQTADLKTELDAGRVSRRNEELAEMASALGLKNNALFKSLMGDAKAEYEGEGKERKLKSIKSGDSKPVPFEDFARTNAALSDALPSLQIGQQQQQQAANPQGAWIAQGHGNNGGGNGEQQVPLKPAGYTM